MLHIVVVLAIPQFKAVAVFTAVFGGSFLIYLPFARGFDYTKSRDMNTIW